MEKPMCCLWMIYHMNFGTDYQSILMIIQWHMWWSVIIQVWSISKCQLLGGCRLSRLPSPSIISRTQLLGFVHRRALLAGSIPTIWQNPPLEVGHPQASPFTTKWFRNSETKTVGWWSFWYLPFGVWFENFRQNMHGMTHCRQSCKVN